MELRIPKRLKRRMNKLAKCYLAAKVYPGVDVPQKYADNMRKTSCRCCSNPRRNSKTNITMQEVMANLTAKEQLTGYKMSSRINRDTPGRGN